MKYNDRLFFDLFLTAIPDRLSALSFALGS